MKPPDAYCGPGRAVVHEGEVPPLMSTRRTETACDVAQKSVAVRQPSPAGLSVMLILRLDSERQKLFRAVQSVVPGAAG